MNYKICVFGTKSTTYKIIEFLIGQNKKIDLVITVDKTVTEKNEISGFESLDDICKLYGIQIFKTQSYSLKDINSEKFFRDNTFEMGISMGWQRLIPEYVLSKFSVGIFGFHGSCGYLPYGRGRSPLNWSIIIGDTRFILNLFKYDEKPDSPNVYKSEMFEINQYDTIKTLQYKNLLCAKKLLNSLLNDYTNGHIHTRTESNDFDLWYSKRTPNDGKIDFKNKTRDIYNLVRGVTKPFPGAFALIDEKKIIIWELYPFDQIMDFSNYKPGEIIEIYDGEPIVRTVDGSIIIHKYEYNGELKKGTILT